jgi:hypothetical protein
VPCCPSPRRSQLLRLPSPVLDTHNELRNFGAKKGHLHNAQNYPTSPVLDTHNKLRNFGAKKGHLNDAHNYRGDTHISLRYLAPKKAISTTLTTTRPPSLVLDTHYALRNLAPKKGHLHNAHNYRGDTHNALRNLAPKKAISTTLTTTRPPSLVLDTHNALRNLAPKKAISTTFTTTKSTVSSPRHTQ